MVTLVVAKNENNVIGDDNQLIWHLPNDLKHFKRITTGHPIIMGRLTFESLGRPLPNRTNIIVTRNSDWQVEGTLVFHSLEAAVKKAKELDDEIFIIGGGQIFEQAMEFADAIEMTEVYNHAEGEVLFPEIDAEIWEVVSMEAHQKDEKHPFDYTFIRLERRR
ncbi:MAG: dihydrofolate reductase [Weeksellaceae bacterium]